MSKILSWHNGMESDDCNGPINFTVPVTFGGMGFLGATGVARFVKPTGVDAGNGTSVDSAFQTIQHAIDAANERDVIVVLPGEYEENLVVETDYLTLVGSVSGYGRPDITPAAGVPLTVTAQGFKAASLRFAATTTTAVLQEGNGFDYVDCVFDGDGGSTVGLHLKGNADDDSFTASEGSVRSSLVRGCGDGIVFDTGDAPTNGVGCTHDVVKGCRFIDNTQDIVTADSGGGVYSVQDTLIDECYFMDKNKTNYIDFTTANGGDAAAQDGMISNCYFNTDDLTTTNVAIVGTGFHLIGCSDAGGVEDASGLD